MTAREKLSDQVLNWNMTELKKPEEKATEELASKNKKVEDTLSELKTSGESVARIERLVRGATRVIAGRYVQGKREIVVKMRRARIRVSDWTGKPSPVERERRSKKCVSCAAY